MRFEAPEQPQSSLICCLTMAICNYILIRCTTSGVQCFGPDRLQQAAYLLSQLSWWQMSRGSKTTSFIMHAHMSHSLIVLTMW